MEQESTVGKLDVKLRTGTGKEIARKLRAAGSAPAVIYGGESPTLSVAFDPAALYRALDPQRLRNTVIELNVEGGSDGASTERVMLKEVQIHPIKQTIVHADFVRVSLDRPIRVEVPLVLEGRPEGVKTGGTLHQVFRKVPLLCRPDNIPSQVVADASALLLGDSISAGDLPLPDGVSICLPPQQTCAHVLAPRAAAAGEGEAPAAEGEAAATATTEAQGA